MPVRYLALAGLLAIGLAASIHGEAAAKDGVLTGTIRSAAGETLGGITVSAKAEEATLATTVYTDAAGAYYFPPMPVGKYRVWAQAVSYETARGEVDLGASRHQDFVLRPMVDFERQLTGDQLLAALPDDTADDRRLKRIVHNNCGGCHTPSYILQHRFDEDGWTSVIKLMKRVNVGGVYQGPDAKPNGIIDFHEKELAAYLARARGPGPTSMKFKLRPRPAGEAARVVVREYDVPLDPDLGWPNKYVANDGSDWSLGTPSALGGARGVHDAVADTDGNLWFTDNSPSRSITIGRIDARSGAVRFFKVAGLNGLAAGAHGMTRDGQGMIWFNTGPTRIPSHGNLARLDPRTETIEVFEPPESMSGTGGAVTVDIDGKGKVWVSAPDGALRFDPVTRTFSEFKSVTFKTPHGTGITYGIAADREGNGWWAQMALDIVGKSDVASGKSLEIKLPPVAAEMELITPQERKLYDGFGQLDFNTPFPWSQGPRRMGADKNGDVVWVCDFWGGNLARIDIHTLQPTIIPLPHPETQYPYHAVVDKNHNVWVNMMNADQVLKYDPKSGTSTFYDLPTLGAELRYISILERAGQIEVILPYSRTMKVAVMTFRSERDLQAAKARVQASNR